MPSPTRAAAPRRLAMLVGILLAVSAALYVARAASTLNRLSGAVLCIAGLATAWSLRPGAALPPWPLSVSLRRLLYVSTAVLAVASRASIVVEIKRSRPVTADILWEITVVLFAASLALNAWVTSRARQRETQV